MTTDEHRRREAEAWADASARPAPEATVTAILPPGLQRRRALRAAGINLSLDDFSDDERLARGYRRRPGLAFES